LYDLALCIDNNDNQMMLLGPQMNYIPSKNNVIVLFKEL